MTSLLPPSSRSFCQSTRTILQTCYKLDSLAARLAQSQTRQFSNSSYIRCTKGSRRPEVCRWKCTAQASASCIGVRSFASKRIITRYDELPQNYDPASGLDFKASPLSQEEVTQIFGKSISASKANKLLRR